MLSFLNMGSDISVPDGVGDDVLCCFAGIIIKIVLHTPVVTQ